MSRSYEDTIGIADPSLARSDDEKVDAVVVYLTEGHLDVFGGYPHDYVEFRGWVFVADLNPAKERNQTQIKAYRRKTLVRWYDEAVRSAGEKDSDFLDDLAETEPAEDTP